MNISDRTRDLLLQELHLCLVNSSEAYHMVALHDLPNMMSGIVGRLHRKLLCVDDVRKSTNYVYGDESRTLLKVFENDDEFARLAILSWIKYYIEDELIGLPKPSIPPPISVPDMNHPLIETVTRVRGVELKIQTDESLKSLIQSLQTQKRSLKELDVKSKRVTSDIRRIDRAIEAVVDELDSREPADEEEAAE